MIPRRGGLGVVVDYAEDGQALVAALSDGLHAAANQHLGDVGRAEAFAGSDDGGKYLLGYLGGVEHIGFAHVAGVAAVPARLLSEVAEQRRAPAVADLAVREHRVELGAGGAAFGLVLHALYEVDAAFSVLRAVEENAVGGEAVASGAPGFLVVAFYGVGHIVVGDHADVGLVYAHAEGDGCDDDGNLVADEAFLGSLPEVGVQSGVIGPGVYAVPCEFLDQFLASSL